MSATTEMKRINGGSLIKTFLKNMNVNGTDVNPRKIYLYSGHDLNLTAVTIALGLKDAFDHPDYANGLVMEKWKDLKNQLYVRVRTYLILTFDFIRKLLFIILMSVPVADLDKSWFKAKSFEIKKLQ